MFPVHLYNDHWYLISVSFENGNIILYDLLPSHGHDETKCMDAVEAYLMLSRRKPFQRAGSKKFVEHHSRTTSMIVAFLPV